MTSKRRFTLLCVLMACTTCLMSKPQAFSQESGSGSTSLDKSLVKELDALRTKVRKLEAILGRKSGTQASTAEQAAPVADSTAPPQMAGKGMTGKSKKTQMGKDKGMMSKNKGMMGKGKGMMPKDKDKMGMGMTGKGTGMMGRGPKMGNTSMQSALPGFPGASHIYHIGETGFFLDHPQHITLNADQQKKLNDVKAKTLLADGTFERRIDQAERQLWMLTAADEPDIKKIEAKIREIAKLSGDRRLAFIRGVGDAAAVLTAEQRQKLLGEHAVNDNRPDPATSNE